MSFLKVNIILFSINKKIRFSFFNKYMRYLNSKWLLIYLTLRSWVISCFSLLFKWTANPTTNYFLLSKDDKHGETCYILSIYIIINKTCAALRPHKCMSCPLVSPKKPCSLWLQKNHFCLTAKKSFVSGLSSMSRNLICKQTWCTLSVIIN